MDSKKISFSGVNTKYQIKKIVKRQVECPGEAKTRTKWVEPEGGVSQETQLLAIADLSNNLLYSREIANKLTGYRHQDALKNHYDESLFITSPQIMELLTTSELTCFYCKQFTPVLYKNVRDPSQWSLDRINNDIGHHFGNVVISCLKCNLQKKRMSSSAFAMSKQMILTRVG
jgi:hypothetical protein